MARYLKYSQTTDTTYYMIKYCLLNLFGSINLTLYCVILRVQQPRSILLEWNKNKYSIYLIAF